MTLAAAVPAPTLPVLPTLPALPEAPLAPRLIICPTGPDGSHLAPAADEPLPVNLQRRRLYAALDLYPDDLLETGCLSKSPSPSSSLEAEFFLLTDVLDAGREGFWAPKAVRHPVPLHDTPCPAVIPVPAPAPLDLLGVDEDDADDHLGDD